MTSAEMFLMKPVPKLLMKLFKNYHGMTLKAAYRKVFRLQIKLNGQKVQQPTN